MYTVYTTLEETYIDCNSNNIEISGVRYNIILMKLFVNITSELHFTVKLGFKIITYYYVSSNILLVYLCI